MHNCRSTHQQQLQKEEITRNRSDNESLSFRSITKIAAIHNPHTTQEITDRKQVVCRVVDHNYDKSRNFEEVVLYYIALKSTIYKHWKLKQVKNSSIQYHFRTDKPSSTRSEKF